MKLPFDGKYPVTQLFGKNPAMYAKFGLKGHNGLDFGLPNGTPILAPHGGIIKEAYLDATGYGKYVKIEDVVQGSVLAHFQEFRVVIGQQVNEGQVVGLSDNTGNSTGLHLHWGYYKFPKDRSNGYNGYIDQYDLVKNLIEALLADTDGIMTISKGLYGELIGKLDRQEKQIDELNKTIEKLKSSQGVSLADCDSKCQLLLSDQKNEIREKIIALIS